MLMKGFGKLKPFDVFEEARECWRRLLAFTGKARHILSCTQTPALTRNAKEHLS